MKHKKKGNKYIFDKRGVFFSLTMKQVDDMIDTLNKIKKEENPEYGCTADGFVEVYDSCAIDDGTDCPIMTNYSQREDCPHWVNINNF